jgi:hypothetical protein
MEIANEIKQKYDKIINGIQNVCKNINRNPKDITIVAVTKTHPPELLLSAIKAGITTFGENYAQEMKRKYEFLSNNATIPIHWHFIGHLQTNKVKFIAPFVDIIHSVDSFFLAEEISRLGEKNNRIIDVLLQVNTSAEVSKFGTPPELIFHLTENCLKLNNIRIVGLMTIGSFSLDEKVYRNEFKLLANLQLQLIEKFPQLNWEHLSMGMSHDYLAAIEEGATIVRIGTALFGERQSSKQ